MPYLNLDLDYFDHRKTKRLIGLLGRGAEVLPIRLWIYCGKFHCEDGKLAGYSEQEIESLASWWGKAGEMLPAMKTSGFMEKTGGAWRMHDWTEHEGHLAAFKDRAKVAAKARWDKAREDATSIALSIANGHDKQSSYHTKPDLPTKPTKPTQAELVIFNKEFERAGDRLRIIRAGYSEHQDLRANDAAEIRTLNARRKELKALLGVTI